MNNLNHGILIIWSCNASTTLELFSTLKTRCRLTYTHTHMSTSRSNFAWCFLVELFSNTWKNNFQMNLFFLHMIQVIWNSVSMWCKEGQLSPLMVYVTVHCTTHIIPIHAYSFIMEIHYYAKLYRGGHFGLTEVVSAKRSRLIVP